ncbi:MAG: DUF3606 domain-containing protein [Bacteroidota bacterium]|nr:DUF3606 domain-containing protein [Bacteroidota bacterium]
MKSKKTSLGRSQDRAKIAGSQNYEVKYEQEKTGKSGEEIKDLIKKKGNSRKAVEGKLSKSKGSKA